VSGMLSWRRCRSPAAPLSLCWCRLSPAPPARRRRASRPPAVPRSSSWGSPCTPHWSR
jgi:hypothetical protein